MGLSLFIHIFRPGREASRPGLNMPKLAIFVAMNMCRFLLPVFFLWPLAAHCQDKSDYDRAMGRFQAYYNKGQKDSLARFFPGKYEENKAFFTARLLSDLKELYGKLNSFRFMGLEPEDSLWLYRGEYSNATHMMGIRMDAQKKTTIFLMHTTTPYADSLLFAAEKQELR